MTKASDNPFPSILVADTADPAAPSNGYHRLFVDTDEKLKMIDHASLVTDFTPTAAGDITTDPAWAALGDLIVGTGPDTAAILTAGADGLVLTTDDGEATGLKWAAAAAGGGAVFDPVAEVFGAPDTAYEFDTSSLTGLTAVNTSADAEDADTTIPGHYYLFNAHNSSPYMQGRYAVVDAPFTAITKVSSSAQRNYETVGLMTGEATPGAMDCLWTGWAGGVLENAIALERWSGPNAYSSAPTNTAKVQVAGVVYLAIKAASDTDVDYLFSLDGMTWRICSLARNPSLTLASVGLVSVAQNTTGVAAAFDYLRIWNSALTFLGG